VRDCRTDRRVLDQLLTPISAEAPSGRDLEAEADPDDDEA
jgi:hypothetical protein